MQKTKLRVESFSISLDGYGAGAGQDRENPLGIGGTRLHEWAFRTRTFQATVLGTEGGSTGLDNDFAARGFMNVGAWIMGRNMFGPNTFHFVTEGIRKALDPARIAADGRDVRIGGGPDTIRQYLREGLIDEMHVAVAPVLLGEGETLFEGLNLPALGYRCVGHRATEAATHFILKREASR